LAWLGYFTEFGEQFADGAGDGSVPFDLAGPAALDGVLDELPLAGQPDLQPRAYSLVVKNLGQRR
jgi:hypothetical protein